MAATTLILDRIHRAGIVPWLDLGELLRGRVHQREHAGWPSVVVGSPRSTLCMSSQWWARLSGPTLAPGGDGALFLFPSVLVPWSQLGFRVPESDDGWKPVRSW